MSRIIDLTPTSTKWMFIIFGIINTSIGVRQIFLAESYIDWGFAFGLLLSICGSLMLIYGLILSSKSNSLRPNVLVDEEGILIKEAMHRVPTKIKWVDIKEITFRSYELNFRFYNEDIEIVNLPNIARISLEVKQAIRQFTSNKKISILGA
ncbi:MAG: hypothetical protein ACFCUU_12210 [Cyclobacteriaceae bacterium]